MATLCLQPPFIWAFSTMVSIVGSDPTDMCSNRMGPAIKNLIFYKIYDIIFIESKGRNIVTEIVACGFGQG